jgi:chromate transporter
LKYLKQIIYLKDILIFSLTAFGGPQGHLGMMIKIFVQKRKYLTINELININTFCQMLPGATSTQTLLLIGYKRGGLGLAIMSLLVWILPASLFMGLLAIFVNFIPNRSYLDGIFKFIQPMAIGFLVYSTYQAIFSLLKTGLSIIIFFVSLVLSLFFFKGPWIFPVILFLGAMISLFFSKRKTIEVALPKLTIRWIYIRLFFLFFFISALLSEYSRKLDGNIRKEFNLVEHFYRFGSIVFGGGDVLIPMMYEQFVIRPTSSHIQKNNKNVLKIDSNDFLIGSGLVRAMPGPVFSIASYMGVMVYKDKNVFWQILGGFTGIIALFLPGILLVLFFYPVFNNFQRYVIVLQSINGIQSSAVGMMLTSTIYLMYNTLMIPMTDIKFGVLSMITIAVTFSVLRFTKVSPHILVIGFIILGLLL